MGLAAGLALSGMLPGCGSQKGPKPLVVGMELTYPPFEMRDVQNRPDGIGVRLAEALAESLGRPLQIEDLRFEGLIPALQTGKIDLIISSMTATEERAQTIDFSDGYVTNGLCMLVAKDSPIAGAGDLEGSGRTIAVKLGTTGHIYARERLPKAKLSVLNHAETCVLEVIQGKADAFIYDQISIYKHWEQHPEETRPILTPIRQETWAIGVRKGEPELRDAVNGFLRRFREDKGFEALAQRYMDQERKAFAEMGVPFIFH